MSNHERPIAWEKHPVSPERKAELRAKGFQIIDAAFMPDGYENTVEDEALSDADERAELIAELRARGADFDEALPTNQLRVLHLSFRPEEAPAKRGRKSAQPQE